MIRITECPRDAMQGIKEQIPTDLKVAYINLLLKTGFDVIDFGSFVSPKAIPQMRDTAEVLRRLELNGSPSELLAIVANERGAQDACSFAEIAYLGFPFSISETFQQRNTNSGIAESFRRVEQIQALCRKHGKKPVIYISMAFGNPYGDPWSPEVVIHWSRKMADLGIGHLALADTVGSSTPETIDLLFRALLPELKGVELGAHLHSIPDKSAEKIQAAYLAGCRNFDVAIGGFGGCPMAKDDLTGNIATEELLRYLDGNKVTHRLNMDAFRQSVAFSGRIFGRYQ